MIRVVVAEDSLTVRTLLVGVLQSDPEIQVIGEAKDGLEVVEMTVRLKPDLVTMDVHMPLQDGFEATKEIMVLAPTPIVIVSSSASGRDVELSLNAMRAGALAVVRKPESPDSELFNGHRERLLAMVKAMAQVKLVRRWRSLAPTPARPGRLAPQAGAIELVAVATSTGGPAALHRVLADLDGSFPVPVLVVQHMAAGFIGGLATWLDSNCDLRVKVAEQQEVLSPRTVYLAPDERHLGVSRDGRIHLGSEPAIGGFRPSATYLFQSAARAYGSRMLAVIMTGMGADGVDGLRSAKEAGAKVLGQDEASSVVYGMARTAMDAGVVDTQLPVTEIGWHLMNLIGGGKRCP
jgi:two-component system chemotaxis response regulator CheB